MTLQRLARRLQRGKFPAKGLASVFLMFLAFMALVYLCLPVHVPPFAYSTTPSFRLQTEALLQGRLALSDKLDHYIRDWALTDNGWYQIWGLGVPLLRLPFDLACKLWGLPGFPDLLFAVLAMAVVAAVLFASLRPYFTAQRPLIAVAACFACVLFLIFSPSIMWLILFWDVYHDNILFNTLWNFLIVAAALTPRGRVTAKHWYALSALCAFQIYLRPTGLAYSGVTVAFFGLVFWRHVAWRHRMVGLAFFAAAQCFLLWLNFVRFGSPFDFGQGMNIPPFVGMGLAQRFGLSLPHGSWPESLAEVSGTAFLGAPLGSYWTPKVPWQASIYMYRHIYYTPFSMWDAAALLLAAALLPLQRAREIRAVFICFLGGFILLMLFYARLEVIASRYFSDLAASLALGWLVLCLSAWRCIGALKPSLQLPCQCLFLALVAGTLFWSVSTIMTRGSLDPDPRRFTNAAGLADIMAEFGPVPPRLAPARYACGKETGTAGIDYNLSRWAYTSSCKAYDFTVTVLASSPCVTYHLEASPEQGEDIMKAARVKSNRVELTLRRHLRDGDRLVLEYCTDTPLTDVGFRQVVALWNDAEHLFQKKLAVKLRLVEAGPMALPPGS